MNKWVKENKITSGIIIVLMVVLGIVYFDKQPAIEPLDSQESKQNDYAVKVTNLYNQMLPTLPAHDIYFIPSKKSYCTVEGCKDMEANVFILVGTNSKSGLFMARCDSKPCDIYDVNMIQSGAFTTFETKEPHGILFRTSNLDQSYIEVVTLGTEAFVSSGYGYKREAEELDTNQNNITESEAQIRARCWAIAPSTIPGNTEKNYQACLRSNGLER